MPGTLLENRCLSSMMNRRRCRIADQYLEIQNTHLTQAWSDRIQITPESAQLRHLGHQVSFAPTHTILKPPMIQSRQSRPSSWQIMKDNIHIPVPDFSRAPHLSTNNRRELLTSIPTPQISNIRYPCDPNSRIAEHPHMSNPRHMTRTPTVTKTPPKEGPRDTPAASATHITAKRPSPPRATHRVTPKSTLQRRQSTAPFKPARRSSPAQTI